MELTAQTAPTVELSKSGDDVAIAIEHGGTRARVDFVGREGESVVSAAEGQPFSGDLETTLPNYERIGELGGRPTDLPQMTVNTLCDLLRPIIDKYEIRKLGYSIAGPVTEEGVVLTGAQLWGETVRHVPYRDLLEEELGLLGGVVLGNDMWAAAHDIMAHGANWTPPFDVESFCVITVSSGIGSKVVLKGDIQLGVSGTAGEIGHMPILLREEMIPGRECGCGGQYCLEAGSSGNANAYRANAEAESPAVRATFPASRDLIDRIQGINLSPGPDLPERVLKINEAITSAAQEDDAFALRVLDRTIRPLARAVAALEVQLNIESFYFVGGFALALGDTFLRILRGHIIEMGIIGRTLQQLESIGRLYEEPEHAWGIRGVGMAAHRLLTP
ncbi:MAG: ROK family protein [Armatimonadota bacterium]